MPVRGAAGGPNVPLVSDLVGHVVRPTRTASWNLVRAGETTASAYATCRPDGRWYVSIDTWDGDAYAPLLSAMTEDLRHDLYTNVRGDDEAELDRWRRLGFEVERREIELQIPVDPVVTGLADVVVPPGIALVPADAVAEDALRELDDQLRAEVPGCDGWRSDPQEFRDRTFDERLFDPLTYLVAIDDWRQEFAGLVRVWTRGAHSRLGLVAVTSHYRRQGLARALLAAAFAPLHERGVAFVTAEVDATNAVSLHLVHSIGAVHTGATLVLLRYGRSEDVTCPR